MKYHIFHRTTYKYEGSVTVSHHVARLSPRMTSGQCCPWHELVISPAPVGRSTHVDSFGNSTLYFEIEGRHDMLVVTARSCVEVRQTGMIEPGASPAWELVRDACGGAVFNPSSDAGQFRFPSPMIPVGHEFRKFAQADFPPGRPILDAVLALNDRIFHGFRFDPRATDVTTPVEQVLARRAGVCQDFAHLMIALIRSMGLPARYVSGYLETLPPPGTARLVGADASHAWVSVFCGDDMGWVDLDPTNGLMPGERHVTVAWGRDFSDVSPLRGVTLGAGDQQLSVSVDVTPVNGE